MSDKIKDLLLRAEKEYGKGSLKFGGDAIQNVPIICSTGSLKMDLALGCGGIPQGRIIEYMGNPSGGKSTLSIITMIEAQKKYPDKTVAFIDLENSFDREWATNLGLDCDKILFAQPDSGEESFSLIDMMLDSNEVSFIVVDSVSGLLTRAQLDAEFDQAQMAQLARLMSQALPKINNKLKGKFATILFISQYRQKLGTYVPTSVTQGGEALKFFTSIRAEISRGNVIGEKDNPQGFTTKIKLVKNKVGRPSIKIETDLFIGPDRYGIDKISEVADLSISNSIVHKAGAWIKYNFKGNEERWQGKDSFVNTLRENNEMYEEIWNQVRKTVMKREAPIEGSFNSEMQKTEQEEPEKKRRGKKVKEENIESEEVNIPTEVNPSTTENDVA
jgi:recombination protein RecA